MSATQDDQSSEESDWSLVEATQAGDMVAFGQLFEINRDQIYRYVLARTSDRGLAEDITSETFVRALHRIDSVRYQGRGFGAWLTTIARNLVLDHLKSSRHRLEQPHSDTALFDPSVGGPEREVIERATSVELLRRVAQLNDDQRECVVLRFWQGFSVVETAQIMQRTEGAVKALQHRAVRNLAQLLPSELR